MVGAERIELPTSCSCWPPSFRGVMSFVAQRPITESNRPPSYQASTNEPESNRHFLCWWPEVIPAYGMARGPTYPVAPEKIIVAAKSLFTCFRITTAHSPTRSTARYLPRGGRLPGTGCEPCFFLEPAAGFEPATSGLQVRCSTAELHRLWSGWAESNPHSRRGRPVLYH